MTASRRPEPGSLTKVTALLQSAVTEPTSAELESGLRLLRQRLAGARSHRRRLVRWSLIAASLAACAALVILLLRVKAAPSEPTVAMSRIEGGELLDGGYLSEVGHAGVKLFFNEGSQFVLDPGTRGRLRDVSGDGARVALDRGKASFRITPSPTHRWSVEAGPFLVTVKGTQFSVSWDPGREQLEVTLERGRVTVNGPLLGSELVLRPGEKLSVCLPKGETSIKKNTPNDAEDGGLMPAAGPSAGPPAALSAPSSGAPYPAPSPAPSAAAQRALGATGGGHAERRWGEALAKGAWDLILADVERDGIEATLRSASSAELFAVADAARYRRRSDWARAALLAHRERFPGSPRSVDATFLLGRVEESTGSGKRAAVKWYEQYLARTPTGAYVAEALGRKMILMKELEGAASARRVAEEYLLRFPGGTYARAARALSSN